MFYYIEVHLLAHYIQPVTYIEICNFITDIDLYENTIKLDSYMF
jgi:hypothetical protein